MSFWKSAKDQMVHDRLIDEEIHANAVREVESGIRRDGLWAKAIIQGAGDEGRIKSAYLSLLVQKLKDERYVEQRISDLRAARDQATDNKVSSHKTNQTSLSPEQKERQRVLRLCMELKNGALEPFQYAFLAKAAGVSLNESGMLGMRYSISINGNRLVGSKLSGLRPWFLENVVPVLEADA